MGFSDAVGTGFGKYADFSGRASRSEYWWWALFAFLIWLIAIVLDVIFFPGSIRTGSYAYVGVLSGITSLALFLPGFAISVRRLHDIDRSGWWWLIAFIPIIGAIVLLLFLMSSGTPRVNRFGPRPTRTRALPGTDFHPLPPGSI